MRAEDVATTVRCCAAHGIPVVARGAGTGLSGGANAMAGCVVVALDAMDRILEIDPVERFAVVEPGVVNDRLRAACAEYGLWYPPDPASAPWSTIGGNVATNAGGVCCLKYGVTGDYVLGLEVVTGTGEIVRLGRRTAKGVAGYDLTSLHGRLRGHPRHRHPGHRPAAAGPRARAHRRRLLLVHVAAGDAVVAVARAGIVPSALELLDRHCLEAVNDWKNLGLEADAAVILLARVDDAGAEGDALAEQVQACFDSAGSTFSARVRATSRRPTRCSPPAGSRTPPSSGSGRCSPRTSASRSSRCRRCSAGSTRSVGGTTSSSPTSPTPATATCTRSSSRRPATTPPATAPSSPSTRSSPPRSRSAARSPASTASACSSATGSCAEISPAVADLHVAIRDALDPHRILNPGKVIDR